MNANDWKPFMVLSPNMKVRDVSSEGDATVIGGVETGEWVAFVIYDNEKVDVIDRMVVATRKMAEFLSKKQSRRKSRDIEHYDVALADGIMAVTDSKMDGKWPAGFVLSDAKRNLSLEEDWGRADDKDDEESFFELAYHLSVDAGSNMPKVESTTYGAFSAMLGAKRLKCTAMRNPKTLLVDLVEVAAER